MISKHLPGNSSSLSSFTVDVDPKKAPSKSASSLGSSNDLVHLPSSAASASLQTDHAMDMWNEAIDAYATESNPSRALEVFKVSICKRAANLIDLSYTRFYSRIV
jgi:hypothetical protein